MSGNEAGSRSGNTVELASYRLSRRGDEMIHGEIRALYSYWERLRAGRPCPERTEVDPRDIAADPRHLFVLEDVGQGNVRFRLAGSALMDAFGLDLRGMSARTIMEGRSRESFVALVSETLAEPGVGYARLKASDGGALWEAVLLPLRGSFGQIDRLIGCLHPVSGRIPVADGSRPPLRFTIENMSIQPVAQVVAETETAEPGPQAGFAEEQAPFAPAPRRGLRAIEGGLGREERTEGARPKLKVVKTED